MEEPLDPISFKKSQYARPQQDWICGRAAEACPCPLGPDKRGNCRATGECFPAKRKDHWHCTRAEARGGKCADGPLPNGDCCRPVPPCVPVRSLRAQRGRFTRLVVTLTGGVLLLLLASPTLRHSWINPGPLTVAHATSATRCNDCHTVGGSGPGAITLANVSRSRVLADSQRCLDCHQLGPRPLAPHGVVPAVLAGTTAEAQKRQQESVAPVLLKMSTALKSPSGSNGEIACATCHHEHQGRNFDLKHLTNTQCQVCHATQFASFADGHPGFGKYPYAKPERIAFDHRSHYDKHFAENKAVAPASCETCHTPDAAGHLMLVKSFEQTCAACHAAQIQGEGMTTRAMAFFTVPGIDQDTLRAKGFHIGTWPKAADARLTPFTRLLLRGDPATRAALQTLGDADLTDLTGAAPERLQAAAQLAWAVKGLLYDLKTKGQGFMLQQLQAEAGTPVSPAISSLVGQLSRGMIEAAQAEWFPKLPEEVSNHRKGIEPADDAPAPLPVPPATPTPAPAGKKSSGDDSLLGGDDLVAAPAAKKPDKKPAAADDSLLSSGDSLVPTPAAQPTPAASDAGDLLSADASAAAPAAIPATPAPAAAPAVAPISREDWVSVGGWFWSEQTFSFLYRPTGHADAFLTAWLGASAARAGSAQAASADPLFVTLSDPQAPGLCTKCHLASQQNGVLSINWTAARPAVDDHSFTKFNHSAHFSLVGDTGCQTCHRLKTTSESADDSGPASDSGVLAVHFESSFAGLSKEGCAQCHKPEIAGDGCLQCHSYHTGTFAARLRILPPPPVASR